MSPRMLWNHLVPWRRRRRYYFLHALARLHEQEADPLKLPEAFGVDSIEFDRWISGASTPRLFAQTMAIMAYKIRPPKSTYLYTPIVIAFLTLFPIAVMIVRTFLLR